MEERSAKRPRPSDHEVRREVVLESRPAEEAGPKPERTPDELFRRTETKPALYWMPAPRKARTAALKRLGLGWDFRPFVKREAE